MRIPLSDSAGRPRRRPHRGHVPTHAQCESIGSPNRALLAGVTLPLEAVRRLNAQYHFDDHTYSSLVVQAVDAAQVSRLAQQLRAMG